MFQSNDAEQGAPLLEALDLVRPGPMRLPRLWSAIHEAIMFIDPTDVAGNKVPPADAPALFAAQFGH